MLGAKVHRRVPVGSHQRCSQNAAGKASAACDGERHDRRYAGRQAVDDKLDDNSRRLCLTSFKFSNIKERMHCHY